MRDVADQPGDEADDEGQWDAERRRFVAENRDGVADVRDGVADHREAVADAREQELDTRERELGAGGPLVLAREGAWATPVGRRSFGADDVQPAAEHPQDAAARWRDTVPGAEAADRGAQLRSTGGSSTLLAREFAVLARELHAIRTVDDVLQRVAAVALEAVDGCTAVSVTLRDGDALTTPVFTDASARDADMVQYDAAQGPCLDALTQPVVHHAGGGWAPWPALAERRQDVVFESVVSCGLLLDSADQEGSAWALNLYSSSPRGYAERDVEVALILAAHAAVAVATARERQAASRAGADLRAALVARDVIGQAKGVLMLREGIGPDEAFDILRRASERLNRRLRDVARDVTAREVLVGTTEELDERRVARALTRMLEAARRLPPDDVAALGQAVAADSGVHLTRIWLADYAHRRLLPLSGDQGAGGFEIDGTMGGRAFLLGEMVEIQHGNGVTLWAPLVNGVDRIGVVQFEMDHVTDHRRGTLANIASMLASEVIARGQYTDVQAMSRRAEPMSLAAEIQWQLFPPATFSTSAVTLAASIEPPYAVAGDAFDYAYNEGLLHAGVFDAVGHDLTASLVANLVVGAYRHARRRGDDFVTCVTSVDRIVDEQFATATYATAVMVHLDTTTGALRWINAGHPAPLLIRRHRLVGALAGISCLPLGLGPLDPGTSLQVNETQLEPGDRVLLYTDGIVEARTAGNEDFGLDRLGEFVGKALASRMPDAEVLRRLSHAVVDHHGGRLNDDATTVLLHWHPPR
jgi:GAF domain-containing protein